MPTCFRLVSLLICCRIWPEFAVRIVRHVGSWKSVVMIKCVCVQLTRNKATFKESSHSRAFWDFGQRCQTKPNWLWGKTVRGVLCLDWSHWGVLSDVLYDEHLSVTGCDIYAKPMLHRQCEKSDIFATSIWPPQWDVQLRRTSFLFVTSTMLLICTSYTVTFYIIQTNIFH